MNIKIYRKSDITVLYKKHTLCVKRHKFCSVVHEVHVLSISQETRLTKLVWLNK